MLLLPGNMHYADKKVTTIMSWMAGLTAGLLGFGLPLVYYSISYFYQDSALRTEAEINGRLVTQLINLNPEMWRYEELRLIEQISRRPSSGTPETRRILDLSGVVVAESDANLDRPIQTRSSPLLDSGRIVGKIEISRSLRPLLYRTGLFAILGSLLGLSSFYALRTYPIRMLRQAVLSLLEEKERAQVTLSSIGDGVITSDAQGNVVLINAAAQNLTGWRQEDARGRSLREIFNIVDEKTRAACENPVEQVLRKAKPVELVNHTLLIARDGTERFIANSAAPIRTEHGKLIGVVLVFRDVTEKQKLEAEMQKAGKLESLGILAGGIAHDFNNLLTVILGNISLAMTYANPDDAVYERLISAETGCLRARNLTYQLLTFSKGGTPVKERVSLPDLIRSSCDFALSGSNVRSEIYITENLPAVKADAGQINQVLHNLIINAIEAMPGGGLITVRADCVSVPSGSALPLPEGAYVRIAVQDRGTGMPKEHLEKIFDPYFTTKKWGSGLGLATTYSIIKNHGGHIAVNSEPGKGTVFNFYLPACSSAPVKIEAPENILLRGTGTILVMDDEKLVRTVASEILKTLGYTVVCAVDGAEAIAEYQKAQKAGKAFELVILDLTIPGGMGGKETIQKIIELDAQVKAIVSSGYSEDPVVSEYGRYGFAGVLNKPYNVRQMSRVLHEILQGPKKNSEKI